VVEGEYDPERPAGMGGFFSAMFDKRSPGERRMHGEGIKRDFFRRVSHSDWTPEVQEFMAKSPPVWEMDGYDWIRRF